jgi:hypothetical protein
MVHQVLLDIPDELYQPLVQEAREVGKRPEEVITDWLTQAVRIRQDRLRRWAGAYTSGVPDAALRHHEHLGEALHPQATDRAGDG